MSNKSSHINWGRILAEMVGIVFAVLLALGLEGWYQDREQQAHAEKILERIKVEITENREEVLEAISTNAANIKILQQFLADEEADLSTIQKAVTISAGSTSDSAWISAQMTQTVSRMPVDMVSELADLYDTQSYYSDYVRFFFREFSDLVSTMQYGETPRQAVQKFMLHLTITNSLAQQVMDDYDDFLGIEPQKNTATTEDVS